MKKSLYVLGLLTLALGLLALGLLGGPRAISAASAVPSQGASLPAGQPGAPNATATATCRPGLVCDSPTPTPCDPAQGCVTATPTPCDPVVGCGTPTATPTCVPAQGCASPTPTCHPGQNCETPTATVTPCDPALGCDTPTITATPTCVPAQGCASPTPTCPPGQVCGTATATPRPPTGTPTPPCNPVPCTSPTVTATPTCPPNQPCASPTPTCPAGQVCGTATPTPRPPTGTPTPPCSPVPCTSPTVTATPTCHPGQVCGTATATATPTCPPNQPCASPTPTCPPGQVCGTPTTTRTRTATATPTRTATVTPTRTPTCIPPPANMTVWYPLDEPVGPIAGDLIAGNNGVHVGGPSPGPGKVAGGLSFDGINDYVHVPNNTATNFGTGDFSIDTWIKTQQSTNFAVFIDKRSYAPIGYELILLNGRLLFQMADSSGYSNYWNSTSVNVADGNWHLVAVTVSRTSGVVGRLYVDGVVILTFTPRLGNVTNFAGLWLGRHHPNSTFPSTMWFHGSLDEVEFFRRALTSAEITNLWTAGSAGKCKPTGSPTPTRTPTPAPCWWCYSDVPTTSAFYPYISCLTIQGIVNGYQCGGANEPCTPPTNWPYYRSGANVTRGQVAKIVSGAAGFAEQPTTQTFADVPSTHPFYLWIEQMAGRGVISGYACGGPNEPCDPQARPYFRPYMNLTRSQLAKIDANAALYAEAIPADQQTFADVPPSNSFWVYTERIALHAAISGYACGGPNEPCDPQARPYYRPVGNVTRGQTAKIVANTFCPDCDITPAP